MGRAYCSAIKTVSPRSRFIFFIASSQPYLYGGRKAKEGFVQKEQPGLGHESTAYGEHLLLPTAQESTGTFLELLDLVGKARTRS